MAFSRSVADVLRISVAGQPDESQVAKAVSALSPADSDALIRAAVYHGIAGYVVSAIQDVCEHSDLVASLRGVVRHAVLAHLRTVADLEYLAGVLEEASVPWLVVKGPVLAETLHEGPEYRSYADLDVLVPPSALRPALRSLERNGSVVLDRNWTLIGREMKGEVHVRLPLGTVADLHWSLLNDRRAREQYDVPTEALLDRSWNVTVGGIQVRTLDAIDTVVHLALHTMLSGGHRLIWLKDVALALSRVEDAVGEVNARATRWRAGLTMAAAAERARFAVGYPSSAGMFYPDGLAARVWLSSTAAVWRLAPVEREDGSGSLGRILARSVRPTIRATARDFAVKARAFVSSDRGKAPRSRIDPGSPASDRFDSGGLLAREAFLDAVGQERRPMTAATKSP